MKRIVIGLAAAIATLVLIGPAQAATATAAKPAKDICFFSSSWEGWHAPRPDLIYLRVRHDVYRLDLQFASPRLRWPDSHLVNVMRGSDVICSPLDLDLAVSDTGGFPEHLFVKTIAKLTPEEVAAIPRKDLP